MKTTVHVMRHGEVHNPDRILYGRKPGFYLSERGRAQAQAVADALADHDIVAVVASPLERAQQTAAPIAAQPSGGGTLSIGKTPPSAWRLPRSRNIPGCKYSGTVFPPLAARVISMALGKPPA